MDIIGTHQATQTKVRFVYKKSEGYQTHYANGAYGAITPRGDMEFNFFFEHRDVPEDEVMKVEGNQLTPEEYPSTDVTVIRDINVGIIMTIEQAEALGKWFIGTIEDYRKTREEKKEIKN